MEDGGQQGREVPGHLEHDRAGPQLVQRAGEMEGAGRAVVADGNEHEPVRAIDEAVSVGLQRRAAVPVPVGVHQPSLSVRAAS